MRGVSIVFTGKEQLEIQEETIPSPGAGRILVRARRTLISTGTEMICYQRNFAEGTHWDNWVKYPFRPGYSLVGVVEEVGSDVTGFHVGDRVALRASHAKYVTADASDPLLTRIPDGVTDEDATWFGIATITQNGVRQAAHAMGDVVAVVGLGILGQLVVQYARVCGAREVAAIDLSEMRAEAARRHGATALIREPVESAKETIERLTDGRLADVVYDVTGHPKVFAPALGLARRFGTVILLGDAGSPADQRLTSDVITKGLRIIGTHDVHPPSAPSDRDFWTRRNMAELFFAYLRDGRMAVNDLITHRFSPMDAREAYDTLARDRMNVLGVIFDWDAID